MPGGNGCTSKSCSVKYSLKIRSSAREKTSTVTAQAVMDDVRVLSIDRDHISGLVMNHPSFSLSLLQALSEKVERLEKLFVSME